MATTYTITWPVVIDQGSAAPIVLTLDATSGTSSGFTLSDGAMGGTFTPSATPSIPAGQLAVTVTYAPPANTAVQTITITVTNSAALTNPSPNSRAFVVTQYGLYQPTFDANTNDAYIRAHYLSFAFPAPLASLDADNHYDPIRVWEALRASTSDATMDQQIAVAVYQKRDLFDIANGGHVAGYHNFSGGERDHYFRTGDPLCRLAVHLLALNGAVSADGTDPAYTTSYIYSREVALAILNYLDAEDCGAAHRTQLDHYVRVSLGHCDQWLVAEGSRPSSYFMAPFMVGITLRALIAYWDRYRENGQDTTGPTPPGPIPVTGIPAKVKLMLDLLWTGGHQGPAETVRYPFWYPDTAHTGNDMPPGYGPTGTGSFGYLYPYAAGQGSPNPSPELNQFLAPAYFWYYQYSGNDTYRQRGDAVFAGAQSSILGGGSWNEKQYHQNYWWSIPGVAYRTRVVTPPPAATTYTLSFLGPTSGRANVPSDRIAVSLPAGTSVANPVTVTFHDGGAGGRFVPASVKLTTDNATLVTRYVPAPGSASSNVTVSVTNDGGLTNPAPITYAVTTVAPLATGYTITPPASSNGVGVPSPPFTVALTPLGSVPPANADAAGEFVEIILFDQYASGSYEPGGGSPYGFLGLTAENPSMTFTYRPYTAGTKTLSPYNSVGFTDPTPAPTYTPSVPSSSGAFLALSVGGQSLLLVVGP